MALSNLNKDNLNRLMEANATVDLEKSKESEIFKSNSSSYGKLSMIISQIEILQNMGKDIIKQSELNVKLHNATCKFTKFPNNIYHFYKKGDEIYCSVLSPADWKNNPPHQHFGSYMLKQDMEFYEISLKESM
jgi:hypothetical protein